MLRQFTNVLSDVNPESAIVEYAWLKSKNFTTVIATGREPIDKNDKLKLKIFIPDKYTFTLSVKYQPVNKINMRLLIWLKIAQITVIEDRFIIESTAAAPAITPQAANAAIWLDSVDESMVAGFFTHSL